MAEQSIFSLVKAIMNPARAPPSPTSLFLAKQMMGSTTNAVFFVLNAPHDGAYRAHQIKILCAAVAHPDLDDELRYGAMISAMFSLRSDPRAALVAFAERNNISYKLELLHLSHGALTGRTRAGQDFSALLDDAEFLGGRTHFKGGERLGNLDDVLESSVVTILAHIIMISSKAVTSRAACANSAIRQMEAMRESHHIDVDMLLSDATADLVADLIVSSRVVRRAIVDLVIACDAAPLSSNMASVVANAGNYLKMAGLTGFKMVCHHVVAKRAPILANAAYRSEVVYLTSIMETFIECGADAPYLKFLCSLHSHQFSPGNFRALHAFAIGCAMEHTPTMAAYCAGADVRAHPCYIMGRTFAAQSIVAHGRDTSSPFLGPPGPSTRMAELLASLGRNTQSSRNTSSRTQMFRGGQPIQTEKKTDRTNDKT